MQAGLGEKFDIKDLGGIQWYCDVVAYDFPILSLFHVDNRHLYFALCIKRKKTSAIWILFDVPEKKLRSFFEQTSTVLELLKQSRFILYFNEKNGGRRNIRKIEFSDIPAQYLPAENSYFDEDFSTDEAVSIARERTSDYSIEIDGDWYLEDLADFPKLYRQVYAFNHGVSNFDDELVGGRIRRSINDQPYKGGYSIVNMLNGMGESIPPTSRVRVEGISKHSPGYIKLRVDQKVAAGVEHVLEQLNDPMKRFSLKLAYRTANKMLDSYGLRSIEISDFNASRYQDYNEILNQIRQQALTIAVGFGYERQAAALIDLTHPLALLKSLLAYARRVFRLYDFIDEGLITKFGGKRGLKE